MYPDLPLSRVYQEMKPAQNISFKNVPHKTASERHNFNEKVLGEMQTLHVGCSKAEPKFF